MKSWREKVGMPELTAAPVSISTSSIRNFVSASFMRHLLRRRIKEEERQEASGAIRRR